MQKPRHLREQMLVHNQKKSQINFRRGEQEQVAAKLFGLDEGDESDSAADHSGWDDDFLF